MGTLREEDIVVMDRDELSTLLGRVEAETQGVDVKERERIFETAFMAARVGQTSSLRPSIEVMLHDQLSGRLVLHVHSTDVNMITCCKQGKEITERIFGDAAIFIPYVDPGFILAGTFGKLLSEYEGQHGRKPRFVIMENHGIVVDGESTDEVREKMSDAHERIQAALRLTSSDHPFGSPLADPAFERMPEIRDMLLQTGLFPEDHSAVILEDSEIVRQFVSAGQWRQFAEGGPLTPDQVVYCGPSPLCITDPERLLDGDPIVPLEGMLTGHRDFYGSMPRIILVQGGGLIAVAKEPEDTARVYEDAIMIMQGAVGFGGVQAMKPRDVHFIDKDAPFEAHRRNQ